MYMYVQRKGLCGCIHNVNKFNVYSSEQIQNINPYLRYIKDWDLQLLLNQLKRSHAHDF